MTDNAAEPYILFELAGTTYGIGSRAVQQMEMVEQITPVPNAPAHVEGVVFLRGQVIPAVNLRRRFGFERVPHDLKTRLIVVGHEGRSVGLVVDSAREFLRIPADAIQPPPEAMAGTTGKYLQGVAALDGRLVLLLDVREVLDVQETTAPAGA